MSKILNERFSLQIADITMPHVISIVDGTIHGHLIVKLNRIDVYEINRSIKQNDGQIQLLVNLEIFCQQFGGHDDHSANRQCIEIVDILLDILSRQIVCEQ